MKREILIRAAITDPVVWRAFVVSILLSIRFQPIFAVVAAGLTFPSYVLASSVTQPMENVESSDSIGWSLHLREILDYDPSKKSILPDFFNRYFAWRREINRKIGLETIFSYYTLTQGYADKDWSMGASSGDLDLTGRWLLHGTKGHRPTYLAFRARYRHAYGCTAPSEIAAGTDLLWRTVDGFTDAGFQVPNLYLSQGLFHGNLTVRYGQISIDNFFDSNKMRSDKHYLLNKAFSANPTVAFPSYGAGFTAKWQQGEKWDFSFGGSNIQGTDYDAQYVSLSLTSTALFVTAQAGYNFNGLGMHDARIQLMGWQSNDSNEEALDTGNGISITLEHAGKRSGERFLLRYAFSGDDATEIDQMLTTGWGRETGNQDYIGFGAGIGRSTEDNDLWQGVAEIYYRWQVTKELTISPDLQVILGKGDTDEHDFHFVAGLRAGLTF